MPSRTCLTRCLVLAASLALHLWLKAKAAEESELKRSGNPYRAIDELDDL